MEGVSEVRRDGKTVVYTTNYIPVIVDDFPFSNKVVSVKIVRVLDAHHVYGVIL